MNKSFRGKELRKRTSRKINKTNEHELKKEESFTKDDCLHIQAQHMGTPKKEQKTLPKHHQCQRQGHVIIQVLTKCQKILTLNPLTPGVNVALVPTRWPNVLNQVPTYVSKTIYLISHIFSLPAFVSPPSHTQFPRLTHGPKFLAIVSYCSQSLRNGLRVFGTGALEERRRSSERASEGGPSKKLVRAREGDREGNMESRYSSTGKASEAAVKTIEAHFVNADAALQVVCYPFVLCSVCSPMRSINLLP